MDVWPESLVVQANSHDYRPGASKTSQPTGERGGEEGARAEMRRCVNLLVPGSTICAFHGGCVILGGTPALESQKDVISPRPESFGREPWAF